jgi:hypothetical protein
VFLATTTFLPFEGVLVEVFGNSGFECAAIGASCYQNVGPFETEFGPKNTASHRPRSAGPMSCVQSA